MLFRSHGTVAANKAVSECDLLIGIGVRFDDRATGELDRFAPKAKIIHVDIDPSAIARNVPVAIPIVGDAKLILKELILNLKERKASNWNEEVAQWKEKTESEEKAPEGCLSPVRAISIVNDHFPEAIISTEVGQSQMWTALFYKFQEPRKWLTSGGLGTMGYGFPDRKSVV